ISDGAGNSLKGTMLPASFRDFSQARFLGVYQSLLKVASTDWQVVPGSWLDELRTQSPRALSIRFIVDGYTGLSGRPHRGRLAGVIGPAPDGEAIHYVAGRRLVGTGGTPAALAMVQGATLTFDVGTVVGLDNTGLSSVFPEVLVGVKASHAAA